MTTLRDRPAWQWTRMRWPAVTTSLMKCECFLKVAGIVAGTVDERDAQRIDVGAVLAACLAQAKDGIDLFRQGLSIEEVADRDLVGDPVHGGFTPVLAARSKLAFSTHVLEPVEQAAAGQFLEADAGDREARGVEGLLHRRAAVVTHRVHKDWHVGSDAQRDPSSDVEAGKAVLGVVYDLLAEVVVEQDACVDRAGVEVDHL